MFLLSGVRPCHTQVLQLQSDSTAWDYAGFQVIFLAIVKFRTRFIPSTFSSSEQLLARASTQFPPPRSSFSSLPPKKWFGFLAAPLICARILSLSRFTPKPTCGRSTFVLAQNSSHYYLGYCSHVRLLELSVLIHRFHYLFHLSCLTFLFFPFFFQSMTRTSSTCQARSFGLTKIFHASHRTLARAQCHQLFKSFPDCFCRFFCPFCWHVKLCVVNVYGHMSNTAPMASCTTSRNNTRLKIAPWPHCCVSALALLRCPRK